MVNRPLLVSEGGPTLIRALEGVLVDRLDRSPVVAITGARQTGKTTLVRGFPGAGEREFISLDSALAVERARREPQLFLAGASKKSIDEIQRAPELLLEIKREVDLSRRKGRFLITGSANLLLMDRVGDSLAGRALYLVMRPMTEREKRGSEKPPLWPAWLEASGPEEALELVPEARPGFDWRRAAIEGGLPPAALAASADDRHLWFQGYVDTYVHRDLRDLAHVGDLASFTRLMRLAALRTGGLLNFADLARDAAVPRSTAQRWLSILEASFLVTSLASFARTRAKRLIKAPKLYPGDTGLGLHLAGAEEPEEIGSLPNTGAWLESVLLNDLLCWRETEMRRPEITYRRTTGGEEIDFVIERKKRLLPIEVKASKSARTADARAIDAFCEEFGSEAPFGVLVYDGLESLRLTRSTIAVPASSVL